MDRIGLENPKATICTAPVVDGKKDLAAGVALALEALEDVTRFALCERIDTGELREFIYVMLLGSFIDLLQKLGVRDLSGVTVRLPYDAPAWSDRYHAYFAGVKLEFGDEVLQIDLPNHILDRPCLTSDEFAYRNAIRECEAILTRATGDGQWSDYVVARLLENKASFPTLEHIAEVSGMSARTLIRHLKAEGTHFQALVDDVRKDLACWQLLNTRDSVESIAEQLGFVDTSNFARVFRRWFACTPSAFRGRAKSIEGANFSEIPQS